jgi:quinolinate synthase
MGANIADLFKRMAVMSDKEIAEIHPDHNRETICSLLPRLHYYQVCVICFLEHFFNAVK